MRLKKIELNLPVFLTGATVIALASFSAGNLWHGSIGSLVLGQGTDSLNYSSLGDLYGLMQRNFDGKLSAQAALDGARKGLVAAGGDPYTVYLTADEAKALNDDLDGHLTGIGAEIGIKNNLLSVISPIDDSPAAKAGLRAGDIIARINGEDTTNMSVSVAVNKIRGPKDTKVTLKIMRSGTPDPFDVTITRDDITTPSVKSSLKNGDVGYIEISRFGPDTADLVDKAATQLKAQGAKKVILDLRDNGGGYLSAGISVASEFLPAGQLVLEERTGGQTRDKDNATSGGQLIGLPTIVLINGGSASASEIVAGALHDHHIAQLVGEQSFGKGSVQDIKELSGGAELKVTIAHWYTPGGVNIDKEGIKPDVEVKLTDADYNADRDPQLDKALELLK